jgi:hypothetical protein
MKQTSNRRNDWRSRWVLWRAVLALGSLASMVLASGAPTHWHH